MVRPVTDDEVIALLQRCRDSLDTPAETGEGATTLETGRRVLDKLSVSLAAVQMRREDTGADEALRDVQTRSSRRDGEGE